MAETFAPALDTVDGGIGSGISRLDGRQKVTGQARYAAEAPMKGLVHAVLVSSPVARGKIRSVDAAAAMKSPGVIHVVTAQNVTKVSDTTKDDPAGGGKLRNENQLPLDNWDIQYAGQFVAAVVAETLDQARHAAGIIKIVYDSEAPLLKIDEPGRPASRPQQGGQGLTVTRGNVDAALQAAKADGSVVVTATYSTPVETHNPMELSATTAEWDGDDKLTVWDATQFVMGCRQTLAGVFKIKEENVRVICPFVGGGFGCKGTQWPHTILSVALARMVKRPVKLMLTRQQMFTNTGHRPATEQTMTLAAGKDGKLAALRHASRIQGSVAGDFIERCGIGTSRVVYAVPNLDITHDLAKVNISPPTFMRAPGEASGMYALECAMDELAYAVNIDPLQLRLINHADTHPHSNKPWSSKELKECYRVGAEKFGWAKRNPKPGSMKSPEGLAMGWGMATATYPAHRFPGTARIRVMRDAAGEVRAIGACATQDLGTGSWTIFTQVTASAAGVPVERAKFELGDSSLPYGPVSGGSTSAASVSQALYDAGNALKQVLLDLALQDNASPLVGLTLNETVLAGGLIKAAKDPTLQVPIADLIERSGKPYIEGSAGPQNQVGTKNQPNGANYSNNTRTYEMQSFGAHFVEVVIDRPGPRPRVTRVVGVMDIGKVINPKTCESQMIGATVMGIGMALLEETAYDSRTAQPINANLADYPVCVNADIGSIESYFIDKPDLNFTAIGARGVGEIGITGVAAAVANAVFHATGKRVRDLPITMDKLL